MSQITKTALAASLKKISETTPIDRITVTQIVEDCGVNRQTFYYHFKDIYDLVSWIYQKETTESIGEKKTYNTWQDGFMNVFTYVLANRNFVLRTYYSSCRQHLLDFLYKEVYNLLIGVVDECAGNFSVHDEDKSFIANFYKYAFVGIMFDWIEDDMYKKPEVLVRQISTLVEGDIFKALERFGRKKTDSETRC
ncbi:MAG TPA: dihydroxyacetone kinase transcriptional activator DhaS [Treponema sp.]|nr:dihydroxyacetone kinase transcriptional activator DhaS [Treponema sp.]